jgi:intergrase/recombinase
LRASIPNWNIKKEFEKRKEPFRKYLLMERRVTENKARDYIQALSNHLEDNIRTPKELKEFLQSTYTDSLAKGLRAFFTFLSEEEEFDSDPWIKAIKIRSYGVREVFIDTQELLEALEHVKEPFLLKAMALSGVRYSHLLSSLSLLDKAITLDSFVRIPTRSISKGKKSTFFIYLPMEIYEELKKIDIPEYDVKSVTYKRVSPNSVRKWFTNQLVEFGINGDLIDFYQGRVGGSIRATVYTQMTVHCDRAYKEIFLKLLDELNG